MIVEIGAGNGTLMTNILDYIKQNHPKIYETVSYTIIEISVALNKIQKIKGRDHLSRLKFENVSIFRWKTKVKEKAFIIALEVIVCIALLQGQLLLNQIRTILLMISSGMIFAQGPLCKPIFRGTLTMEGSANRLMINWTIC